MKNEKLKTWLMKVNDFLHSISKKDVEEITDMEEVMITTMYDRWIEYINGDNREISKMINSPFRLLRNTEKMRRTSKRRTSKSRSYGYESKGGTGTYDCIICLDYIDENERCFHGEHYYHHKCLQKWILLGNTTCLSCTQEVEWICNGGLQIDIPRRVRHQQRQRERLQALVNADREEARIERVPNNKVREHLVGIILFIVWVITGLKLG
jgi:hypothetical protein